MKLILEIVVNILRFSGFLLKMAILSLLLLVPDIHIALGSDSFSLALKNESEIVRAEAISTFRKKKGPFSDESIGLLGKALNDPSSLVRREAMDVLEILGPKAKAAVPDIIHFLSNIEPGNAAQIRAPLAIKSIGINNNEVHSKLKEILQIQDSELLLIRINSIIAIGELKGNPKTVEPFLESICRNNSEPQELRMKCWVALARIQPSHPQAIEKLIEMIKEGHKRKSAYVVASGIQINFTPRFDALKALSDIEKIDLAVPILIDELKSASSERERNRVILDLKLIKPTSKGLKNLLPYLKQFIESGNIKGGYMKYFTLQSIALIGGPIEGKEFLREFSKKSDDAQAKSFATQILKNIK